MKNSNNVGVGALKRKMPLTAYINTKDAESDEDSEKGRHRKYGAIYEVVKVSTRQTIFFQNPKI